MCFKCQCVTRAPLPKFKLIGNIHFPKIKRPPSRATRPPPARPGPATDCPPCPCC
ncbi:hypothetical protein JYU34_010662 [Plutella xylostella]|uniref:Uncharacterized protein n=2 Tax=Plutella xylostella TaxID=51655 RepID=A0ABQ7QG60_PLUXY|nr:hypothetical protein JYU34_010662 [Plutella xylostella]CAG9133676.1 unnamed protein product [Plutella xylostella]